MLTFRTQPDTTMAEKLSLARQLHDAGRHTAAARHYQEILRMAPNFAAAHHFYALLLKETGRATEALAHFKLAIVHNRDDFAAMLNLALTLFGLQRLDEASQCFKAVLSRDAKRAEAWRGLGMIAMDQGENAQAAALLNEALRHAPKDSLALVHFALVGMRLGHVDGASVALVNALAAAPADFELLKLLGDVLLAAEMDAQAAQAFERALALQPQSVHAAVCLGAALVGLGQHRRAAMLLEPALEREPGRAAGWVTLSMARRGQHDLDGAEVACRRALALEPDGAAANAQLALLLQGRGLPEQALALLDAWTARSPYDPAIERYRALLNLLLGNFDPGWRQLEARLQVGQRRRSAAPGTSLWAGEDIAGRTVLVEAEEGFGDTSQFCRYAAELAARGARVVLTVAGPLHRLMATVPGVSEVRHVTEGDLKVDVTVPILSLPLRFATREATIPAPVPYISVAEEDVARWQARIARAELRPGLRKVGLVWAGNPNHRNDFARSIDFALLDPLLACEAAVFFSLQVGAAAAARHPRLRDLSGDLADYYETAAAIRALDLIITVDTSVAHLAGALGAPVWTLLAAAPDWRWRLERSNTPWYPTMRLFRQEVRGNWTPVIARLVDALSGRG
jgi:tetratricopeptide (TPR) repeat protein